MSFNQMEMNCPEEPEHITECSQESQTDDDLKHSPPENIHSLETRKSSDGRAKRND